MISKIFENIHNSEIGLQSSTTDLFPDLTTRQILKLPQVGDCGSLNDQIKYSGSVNTVIQSFTRKLETISILAVSLFQRCFIAAIISSRVMCFMVMLF